MSNQIYSNQTNRYSQTARYDLIGTQTIDYNNERYIVYTETYNNIEGLSYDPSTGNFTITEEMNLKVFANVAFAANPTGQRYIYIGFNGKPYGYQKANALTVGEHICATSAMVSTNGTIPSAMVVWVYQNISSAASLLLEGTWTSLLIERY